MFRHSEGNIVSIEANYHMNFHVSLKITYEFSCFIKKNVFVICNELVPVKASPILKKECCRLGFF